jgi:hypothetical protein
LQIMVLPADTKLGSTSEQQWALLHTKDLHY